MRHSAITTVATALLVATGACSDPLAGPAERLYGSWLWTRSCGGITGHCITPESTGYTERIDFERAWAGGVAGFYRNDTLYSRQRFHLRRRDAPGGAQVVIYYAERLSQIVRFEGEVLVLIDECSDCFENRYVRSP